MNQWRTGISFLLLLALFVVPLLQAATMNSAMAMSHDTLSEQSAASHAHDSLQPGTDPGVHEPALTHSPDTGEHSQHAGSDAASTTADSCHGDPVSMDCCTLCASCAIPVTAPLVSGSALQLHTSLASNTPEPLLATRKRPPRKTS